MNRAEVIRKQMENNGIYLSSEQTEKFSEYFDLLGERNKQVNLTAITEFGPVVEKHFIDSLVTTREINITHGSAVLDVGSGAGFPGIPLAIARPDIRVTLLDSLKKRSEFQADVKEALSLDNLSIVNGRAEDVSRETLHRETYDLVVSRAVADLSVLAEYCLPFVKVGGLFVASKGDEIRDELDKAATAVEVLGGGDVRAIPYVLPECASHRNLVVISKVCATPEKYPRRAGIPSKRPL